MRQIAARKTVIEVRIPAKLGFYSRMDMAAQDLMNDDFSDWLRGPNAVEVQDRTKHRRARLDFNRVFFESEVESREGSEAHLGLKMLKKALKKLEVNECIRIGLRQWFAIEYPGLNVGELTRKITRQFSPPSDLETIVGEGFAFDDVAYNFEFEHINNRDHCRLIIGAMDQTEWANHVPYESAKPNAPTHLGKNAVAEIVDTLPKTFMFVDLDFGRRIRDQKKNKPLAADDSFNHGAEFVQRSKEIIRRLMQHTKDGRTK